MIVVYVFPAKIHFIFLSSIGSFYSKNVLFDFATTCLVTYVINCAKNPLSKKKGLDILDVAMEK